MWKVSIVAIVSMSFLPTERQNPTNLEKEVYTMVTLETQNKEIVRHFYEAFSADDESALKAVLLPELVAYTHGSPNPQNRLEMLQSIRMWNAAFETNFTIEEQIAEGDKVATRVTMHATHNRGEFQGLSPTGKKVSVSSITIEHINNGKIVERRVVSDLQAMIQQLDLIPPPQVSR
jgi:predicted ester cyclase